MTDALNRRLLTLNKSFAVINEGDNLILLNMRDGSEAVIGKVTAQLLDLFSVPRTIGAAARSPFGRILGLDASATEEHIRSLIDAGVIVDFEPDNIRTPQGRGGMYNSPVLLLHELLRSNIADVVFVGVPYDAGASNRPGSRFAPSFIRRVSGAIYQYPREALSPPGFWDPVNERQVFDGIRIADLGDIATAVCHRNGDVFDQLEIIIGQVTRNNILPVTLGGDHSLSLATARGLLSTEGAIGIIHIDAHDDFGSLSPGDWRKECHHGNFMNWLISDDRVKHIAQLGVRQLTATPPPNSEKVNVWPGVRAISEGVQRVLDTLPDDLTYLVTIDVDAIDPGYLRSTGTPCPGGFVGPDLTNFLMELCKPLKIGAIDVVELIPDPHYDVDGLYVADLLLRIIDVSRRKSI